MPLFGTENQIQMDFSITEQFSIAMCSLDIGSIYRIAESHIHLKQHLCNQSGFN